MSGAYAVEMAAGGRLLPVDFHDEFAAAFDDAYRRQRRCERAGVEARFVVADHRGNCWAVAAAGGAR